MAVHQYRSCEHTINKLSRYAPMDAQKQAIQNRVLNCEVEMEKAREQKEAERAAEIEKQKKQPPQFTK